MTRLPNRRPSNRPALPTPAQIDDPPVTDLHEWWHRVKRYWTEQNVIVQETGVMLGVQITDEVTARITADEVLATEIESLVVVIGTKSKITVASSAPSSPAVNDLWLDTSDQNKYKFWDGAAWQYKQDLVLAASITTESTARATADGFLSGKYTLTVAAGNVVTGMNITSSSGGGTNISDVTFVATNFKIYNGTTGITMFNVSGSTVNLAATLTVSTSGKVFIGAGNYGNTDTSWYVDSAGKFSLKDKLTWDGSSLTISGALNAATGTFSGSLSGATGTFSGSLSAASGTFTGSLSAATGTFSGTLSINTGADNEVLADANGLSVGGRVAGGPYMWMQNWSAGSASSVQIQMEHSNYTMTFGNNATVAGMWIQHASGSQTKVGFASSPQIYLDNLTHVIVLDTSSGIISTTGTIDTVNGYYVNGTPGQTTVLTFIGQPFSQLTFSGGILTNVT